MNCPVCNETLNAQATVCSNCGFDELHKKFSNNNEREKWLKETVEPCRKVFVKCAYSYAEMQEIATLTSALFFDYIKANLSLIMANKEAYWQVEDGLHNLIESYHSELENGLKEIEEKYNSIMSV